MLNSHILQRLSGIQKQLISACEASAPLSNATKGTERENFIDNFLGNVLPPASRFGTGDATDASSKKSGQLDVVIEYPFAPSLPAVGASKTRLYLAEGVAAVLEVKSDVSVQWDDVLRTAVNLAPLRRKFLATMVFGGKSPTEHIPLIAIGYKGWKTVKTCEAKLDENPALSGIFVIDPGIFVSKEFHFSATGALSLWGLISVLHMTTNSLANASTNPLAYIVPDQPNSP
jgi:hypothetical protein